MEDDARRRMLWLVLLAILAFDRFLASAALLAHVARRPAEATRAGRVAEGSSGGAVLRILLEYEKSIVPNLSAPARVDAFQPQHATGSI